MDNPNNTELVSKIKARLFSLGQVVGFLAVIYLAGETMSVFKEYKYIGSGVQPVSVISVSGKGEVFAVPDLATVTFSATKSAKTMELAQKDVTTRINAATDFVKSSGVAEKDIKTTNYSAYPKYEYQRSTEEACIYGNCPSKQVLVGYEVSETVSVKVRKTDDTGKIIAGLGKLSVSDISGPNFSIDDEDAVKAEARKKAIEDAKGKADILAKDLGVTLVRVISFSENSGGYPVYYAKTAGFGMGGSVAEDSVAPQISKGENKITVDVSISYEIK
jgi:hypothetical protein